MPYKNIEDQKRAQHEHYLNNKSVYSKRARRRQLLLRDEVNKIKEERGCADCKIKYPYYVLQFDHLDGNLKVEGINYLLRRTTDRTIIMAEIAKCDVVCANCHAVRSFKRKQE